MRSGRELGGGFWGAPSSPCRSFRGGEPIACELRAPNKTGKLPPLCTMSCSAWAPLQDKLQAQKRQAANSHHMCMCMCCVCMRHVCIPASLLCMSRLLATTAHTARGARPQTAPCVGRSASTIQRPPQRPLRGNARVQGNAALSWPRRVRSEWKPASTRAMRTVQRTPHRDMRRWDRGRKPLESRRRVSESSVAGSRAERSAQEQRVE